MKVQYVTNASAQSGVGHQAQEIARRLQGVELTRWHIDGEGGSILRGGQEVNQIKPWSGIWGSKSVNWVRLGRALAHQVSHPHPSSEDEGLPLGKGEKIYHFTNQTLSFLAKKLQPSVVTVHDIIELLEPQDKKAYWLNRYLYGGIPHAQHIICVSEYTKQTVQEYYGISEEKITVIHNGVGPEFHPIPHFAETLAYKELRHELELPDEAKVVLYVGSDHPRKNMITAIQAFARAQKAGGSPLVFLKIGAAGLSLGRTQLLDEIDTLGIRESVRFKESVSTEELNIFYNLADVFLYPSRFEGFGLPPLQAMAAGVPVITSTATSIPEVVGGAAMMREPDDVDGLAEAVTAVMTDSAVVENLRQKGFERAARFSWDVAAQKTREVYHKVYS